MIIKIKKFIKELEEWIIEETVKRLQNFAMWLTK